MSGKMQVVFAKQTGHVLTAFTRTADPEGKVKVGESGGGLLVRHLRSVTTASQSIMPGLLSLTATVPAEALDSAVVDFHPAVFVAPRRFVVGGGEVAELGANTVDLGTANPLPVPPLPPATSHSPLVNLNTVRATVQIESAATEEKGVCIVLQEAAPSPGDEIERRIAQGAIPQGEHFVSLDWKTSPDGSPASVSGGRGYTLFVLIAGYQPLFGVALL